jgi:hypothetical protein
MEHAVMYPFGYTPVAVPGTKSWLEDTTVPGR